MSSPDSFDDDDDPAAGDLQPVPPPAGEPPYRVDFPQDAAGVAAYGAAIDEWYRRNEDHGRATEAAALYEADRQMEIWRVTFPEARDAWRERSEAARRWAELGLPPVRLPGLDHQGVCACNSALWAQGKPRPCPAPGKHPDFGYQDKAARDLDPAFAAALFRPRPDTRDTAQIDGHHSPVPGVGVVLLEGRFMKLDFDRHDDGHDGLVRKAELEAELGPLPETLTAETPRHGEHHVVVDPRADRPDLYFRAGPLTDKDGNDIRGVDLVCNGQSSPMPPTIVPAGAYTIIRDMPPAELPEAWIEFLRREPRPVLVPAERRELADGALPRLRAYMRTSIASEAQKLAEITDSRNDALNVAAYRLGRLAAASDLAGHLDALPAEVAYDHLIGAAEANGYIADHGLARAASTFWSGWHGGLRDPRTDLPESLFEDQALIEVPYPPPETIMSAEFSADGLEGRFCWIAGAKEWRRFDGTIWAPADKADAREVARVWLIERLEIAEAYLLDLLLHQMADGEDIEVPEATKAYSEGEASNDRRML